MGDILEAIKRAAEKLPPKSTVPVRLEMASSTFYAFGFARLPRVNLGAISLPVLSIWTDVDLPHGVVETVYADGHRERGMVPDRPSK